MEEAKSTDGPEGGNSQISPFPAPPAQCSYATVPRRYFDVQNIKRAPTAERPVDSCVVRIVRSPKENQFLRLHKLPRLPRQSRGLPPVERYAGRDSLNVAMMREALADHLTATPFNFASRDLASRSSGKSLSASFQRSRKISYSCFARAGSSNFS